MRSRAPYRERFSERFRQNDEYVRYLLRTVIDQGVEGGVFDDVDAAWTRAVVLEEAQSLETAKRTPDESRQAILSLSAPCWVTSRDG